MAVELPLRYYTYPMPSGVIEITTGPLDAEDVNLLEEWFALVIRVERRRAKERERAENPPVEQE